MDIPENSINEILKSNPSQGTLYVLLQVMKDSGRHNIVIGECVKALLRYPEDLVLRKILAEAYLDAGRLAEAESEFEKVIKGIKNLAGVYRSRAEILIRQKKENEAADILRQYLVFAPEDQDAAILLEELLTTIAVESIELHEEQVDAGISETVEPAVADLMETEEPDEFPEIITASLAQTYFDQGKLTEAREIYEKLIEKAPDDAALRSRLGEITALMEQKDEKEAREIENTIRRKKERMISILDSWRGNIKGLAEEGARASDI